jgi:hypothetical protein
MCGNNLSSNQGIQIGTHPTTSTESCESCPVRVTDLNRKHSLVLKLRQLPAGTIIDSGAGDTIFLLHTVLLTPVAAAAAAACGAQLYQPLITAKGSTA